MRTDTSIAHSPYGTHTLDRLRPERGRATVLGSTTVLESLCVRVVDDSRRHEKLPSRDDLGEVRRAAQKLARQGVVLRDAQRAVHGAVSAGLRGSAGSDVVDSAVFMMQVLEMLGNAVSSAYIDQCRLDSGSATRRVAQLVELLVADDPDARVIAERTGVDLSATYDVVVVQFIGETTGDGASRDAVDNDVVAAPEAALSARNPGRAPLPALTRHGGTILVPCGAPGAVDGIVEDLTTEVGVALVAATAPAVPGGMGVVLAHCRELVDLALSLGREHRLYRTGDLALEYQLSRPGPGRSRLRSVIAPLEAYPELLHTLRTFIANEANRRVSAKSLYVHPNTVDYRLKRVEQLTGVDPLSSAGLMQLHASLVVDCVARAHGSGPTLGTAVAQAS